MSTRFIKSWATSLFCCCHLPVSDELCWQTFLHKHCCKVSHHKTMQNGAQLTAMLMTLTECFQEEADLHRQCLCVRVCVFACVWDWKTDYHDITVSTGNNVSKTLVFHSAAHLIYKSFLPPSCSFLHTQRCIVVMLKSISLAMHSDVIVPTCSREDVE